MNIGANTGLRPDASTASAAQRKSSPSERGGAVPEDIPARSGAAVADTVEISGEARAALQASMEVEANAEIGYTADDLAPLKERFSKLLKKEKNIFNRIAEIMSKPGFKRGAFDQLKIEINKDGKAIVGGLGDVKTARALEKAINGDPKLLNDIITYQAEEKSFTDNLHAVTGKSLTDYAEKIDALQRIEPPLAAEMINLKEEGINGADPELAAMIGERAAAGSAYMDISGLNNILEDAQGTVDRMMRKVTGNIAGAFREMNKGIRMNAAQADDPMQYIEDSVVDINRLKITVDNNGQMNIEGEASKNNRKTDRAAKKIVNEMFEKELEANPVTGEQHDFKIAATYLLNQYDETFGEGNPLGLGEAGRTLESVFDHGEISSRVNSPEREAELNEEINKSAKDALKEMGVNADDLVIEMNDEGKLVATNFNPDSPEGKKILQTLDILNKKLENRSLGDAQGKDGALTADPVGRLRGLMTNMDVLRPGGTRLLQQFA